MTYFDNPNRQFIILNRIDDPVSAMSDAVFLLSAEFCAIIRSRIEPEALDQFKDFYKIFLGNGFEIFINGFLEIDFIFGHLFSAF